MYRDFKPGTIRGPYDCGLGTDSKGGVQFLVKTQDGAWAPFIKPRNKEREARKEAEDFAKTILDHEA